MRHRSGVGRATASTRQGIGLPSSIGKRGVIRPLVEDSNRPGGWGAADIIATRQPRAPYLHTPPSFTGAPSSSSTPSSIDGFEVPPKSSLPRVTSTDCHTGDADAEDPEASVHRRVKEQAVKRVKDGKRVSAVAKEMGLVEQSLRNRVKAFDVGRLNGAGAANAGGDGAVASARAERAAQARGRDLKKSDGVLRAGCAVKDAWIAAHRDGFALNALCDVLAASVGGIRGRHKRRDKATTETPHTACRWPTTCLRATSPRAARTSSGVPTSPTCGRMRAGYTWPSSWTCSTAGSWAGR